jgi:CRP-like cAMP-binding protein
LAKYDALVIFRFRSTKATIVQPRQKPCPVSCCGTFYGIKRKKMNHILVEMMSELTHLTEEEKSGIENSFPVKELDKGTYLLKEGQIAQNAYFVINGCIREYELMNGEEKTIEFYTEHQSAANFNSLANKIPSKRYFICNEKTTVAILSSEKEKELYIKHPRFEAFCRTGMEKMFGEKQNQLAEYISLKPKERYLKLQKLRPDLINRVPQYQIASYLGIKPETLSRIRKRFIKS